MNILIFILLSLMQNVDTSGNRILTDSVMNNPEILLNISQDTNYVTSEFKKYESTKLLKNYINHIKTNFFDKDYKVIQDTLVKVYSEKYKDNFYYGYEIIYNNKKDDKYIHFGFSLINSKWKIEYITTVKPGTDLMPMIVPK